MSSFDIKTALAARPPAGSTCCADGETCCTEGEACTRQSESFRLDGKARPAEDQASAADAADTSEITDPTYLPPEARLILSALEAGESPQPDNRRDHPRTLYNVRANLKLFSDPEGSQPWKLYTRDISARSVGFLTPHRLPLGYGGIVEFPSPDGKTIRAHCTLFRCRQTARGWFEGALSFHKPQPALGPHEQHRATEDEDAGL